ncbi:OapA family protein [Nitrococcus mobilis]|uniref:Metalloendopeptidase-like membrane protein n=1 Tax=Nitrococcus mobilis Nb-231 TaxID=314278 RepID=A4BVU2_9GAMM|nr:peptidoglycan DD-metalloendopeptidase family protein [Nitrococcus mobilis]EAR20157.1 metalloendopeptidase-like membrane protein [Nitrococcus mobilis Nb-231]
MAFKSRISGLDFKPKQKRQRPARLQRWHWIALGISSFTALALLLATKDEAGAIPNHNALQQLPEQIPEEAAATRILDLPIPKLQRTTIDASSPASPHILAAPIADHPSEATPNLLPTAFDTSTTADETITKQPNTLGGGTQAKWEVVHVKQGDSLTTLLKRQGLSSKDIFDVTHADDDSARTLAQLFPGDKIWLRVSGNGTLLALRRRLDETKTLTIARGSSADIGFQTTLTEHQLERRIAHATAVIHDSLYQAAVKAGLDDKLIMKLTGIFGWDIDFAHDVRSGDSFTLVYRQYYRNGEKIRNGEIVAAEFANQGKRYRAIRYTAPSGRSGYYTPEGKSMRKAFLRTPVDFRRISSRFNKSRCHPILHVCRPHEGTDFAAATGTPIQAAGDGLVAFAGRRGGYGNAVILQHAHRYSTLYGHMQRIRKGIRAGVQVTQGQIIGYVGQSGLATGPHLHYEFRVNGVPRDALKVTLPDAKPIDSRYLADFKAKALSRLAQLTVITRTQLASNEENDQTIR